MRTSSLRRWSTLGAAVGALALVAVGGVATAAPSRARASHPVAVRPATASTGDLTTYEFNNERTGDDTVDPAATSISANPKWDTTLDGSVFGEPLIYNGVIYVATEDDSVYALSPVTGHVEWRDHVGNPASLSIVDSAPTLGGGCGDIDPLGITGTPVLDTATGELFATEETLVGGSQWQDVRHWMVAISLKSHAVLWHRDVDPPDGNEASHYYIPAEQERSAATLLNGKVYTTYGGLDGDCGKYHGYVVGLSVKGTGALYSYQVPTDTEGGIWGGGGAVASAKGDLYVATGNGSSNSLSHYDEGNSVVELSSTLHRLGYWAPSNWVELNDEDWDLGSASPLMVPGTDLLFAAGKPSDTGTVGYLMRQSPLDGIGKGAVHGNVCGGGGVFGASASAVLGKGAAARTWVYTGCTGGTEGIELHTTSPLSFHEVWTPSTGSPSGPPIVAGGLVWALNWGGNELYAMSPTTGHVDASRPTDALNHFATPGYGDGLVLIPTQSGVEAYRVG